jgi:dephospho-CoA kinase
VLRIGLTGGIGSGKSAVAERFVALGAGLVDTDRLARELTEPGTPALARIGAAFGPGVLAPDGALDRGVLRALVFADPGAKARLEAILHPRIRALMAARAARLRTPYCLLAVPLLFESGWESAVDRVLVVDCPEEVQVERVGRRSGLAREEVRRILAAQLPRAERLARADDAIDNGGPLAGLEPQVQRLHRRYLALAAGRPVPGG